MSEEKLTKIFSNFEASYQDFPDGFILDWNNKDGSLKYSFTLIRRGRRLFISGDLGSAVIDGFDRPYELGWYSRLEAEYFISKAACTTDSYYYDVEEHLEALPRFIRSQNPDGECDNTDDEFEDRLNDAVEEVMTSFDENRGISIDVLVDQLYKLYGEADYLDASSFYPDFANKHLNRRVKLWMTAMQMACLDLKERGIFPDSELRDLALEDIFGMARLSLLNEGATIKHNGKMYRIKSFVGRRSIIYAYRCEDNQIVKFENGRLWD